MAVFHFIYFCEAVAHLHEIMFNPNAKHRTTLTRADHHLNNQLHHTNLQKLQFQRKDENI
jgi:hypothetical protein